MTGSNGDWEDDALFDEAVRFVIETRSAAAGALQRQLRIGYSRALRLLGEMERIGVVGPADAAGSREVLVLAPPGPQRPPACINENCLP